MTTEEKELIEKAQEMKAELDIANREIERLNAVINAGDKVLAGRQKRVLELKEELESERLETLRLTAENVALRKEINRIKINIDAAAHIMCKGKS